VSADFSNLDACQEPLWSAQSPKAFNELIAVVPNSNSVPQDLVFDVVATLFGPQKMQETGQASRAQSLGICLPCVSVQIQRVSCLISLLLWAW
jgi:hypothetical protein